MADADFDRYCVSFGRGIRRLRLSQELTQEDMMALGFSLRHYQRIEAGRSITLRTLLKLARAFRVQPRDLLPPAGPARGG
jgi:transcriptional regulator with XRE-family HTH domain